MLVEQQLKELISESTLRNEETRSMVPFSHVHRKLYDVAVNEFPKRSGEVVARLSPIAEWMVQTRTTDQFQVLKRDIMNLYLDWNHPYSYEDLIGERFSQGEGFEQVIDWENYHRWAFPADGITSLAANLKLLLNNHIDQVARESGGLKNQLWAQVEGDIPYPLKETHVWNDLDEMAKSFAADRITPYYRPATIGRLTAVFGDFRVGDHSAHGELIKKAKIAAGRTGQIVVITPSKKTILATTNKTDSWDDNERLYRLTSNRDVDNFFMADMPEELYGTPDIYWRMVWKKVSPDVVILGEENHPLQAAYELNSRFLGGLLIVDPKPISVRSGQLLGIK